MAQLKKKLQEKGLQKQGDNKFDVKLTGYGIYKRKQTQKRKGMIIKGTTCPNKKVSREKNKKSTSNNKCVSS